MTFVVNYILWSSIWAVVSYFLFMTQQDKKTRIAFAIRQGLVFFVFSMILHFWGITGWAIAAAVFMVIVIAEAVITVQNQGH